MFRLEKNKLSEKLTPLDNQVVRSDDPLPVKSSTGLIWGIFGKKGSGKSSLLLNALKTRQKEGGLKKAYDRIYLISPTASNDKKFSKLVDELRDDGRFFEKLSDETIRKIVDETKMFNESDESENPRSLLILDDCMTDLPKSVEKGAFNDLVILARHYRLSLIILCQKYLGLNRTARSNMDLISFFRTDSKKELKTLTDDVNTDADKMEVLYNFATKDSPNDFLHINLLSTPVAYYKKFDRIII